MCCNIMGTDGYSRHSRSLFNALYPMCEKIHLETQKVEGWEMQVNDAELNAITTEATNDMDTICISTPPNWPFFYTDPCKRFYGFVVWEGTKVPAYWEEYINNEFVDGIFVPSEHVKIALENTFEVKKPIYIIPHGVNTLVFQPKDRLPRDTFKFMANKGWALGEKDRGGIPLILRAFTEEFKEDEDVELLLKINPSYIQGDVDSKLKQAITDLNLKQNRRPIAVNYDMLSDDSLCTMYNDADCFVSASYAEGFNIPVLEAMACKKPAIVTGFGGHLDFMSSDWGWIVSGDYVKPDNLMYENAEWFECSLLQLKKAMRYAFSNRDEVLKRGEKAYHTAVKYTWRESANLIKNVLD